jgi:4-amino-4-deoxy-L-arabinose transferase-like glycosyltransferase
MESYTNKALGLRHAAILVVVVVSTAVPFLWQPFHMDDALYMDMASRALRHPLYPSEGQYCFEGKLLADTASNSHPPLQAYFLALLQHVFGMASGNEWKYHLCTLVFPVAAVIFFYFLCARFLEMPLQAALLLALSPVFIVMQHNLMTDIPMLALWLAAVVTFLWATESGRYMTYAVSSTLQFAAMFMSYQALTITPLLVFYQARKRKKTAGWLALLIPPLLLVLWVVFSSLHYHRFILFNIVGFMQSKGSWSLTRLAVKFLALLQYQGWMIVFPLALLFFLHRRASTLLLLPAGLLAICAAWLGLPQYRFLDKSIFVVGILGGTVVLMHMVRPRFAVSAGAMPADDGIDGPFIWLWYFGVSTYCVFVFSDGSARYILPLIPPVLIVLCRFLEKSGYAKSAGRFLGLNAMGIAIFVAALSGVWGLALAYADLEFASVYPRAAREFMHMTGTAQAFYGGEWGFRYYFAEAGVKQLSPQSGPLSPGDWIVRPRLALPYELDARTSALAVPIRRTNYNVRTPLRLLDWQSPAGFYSTFWGKIPFSFSWSSLEELDIRRIKDSARP